MDSDLFDWAEYVENSTLPAWLKWLFYIILILLALKLISQRIGGAIEKKEKELNATNPNERILEIAMTHKIFKDKIDKETDPKKKAQLIKSRDELLGKYKSGK